MHKLTFFPSGNADTTLIELSNGINILWDYANMKNLNDINDKRCNLSEELNKRVTNDYDIVTFTHADRDHINGFSDFFYLEHAKKYQDNNRKKIKELWVPASVLIDNQADDEAKILKTEARYRLKNKKGIKIFSRPKKMKDWCDKHDDISYEDVKHLFIDAGKTINEFNLNEHGLEFFVHAPFYSESQNLDRNKSSIVVQVTFDDRCKTKLILGADSTHEVWQDIINITRKFNNSDKLKWDIFHISHHCSYLSLSNEKGNSITLPKDELNWLFKNQGNVGARLISPSKPIPSIGSIEDLDNNPPHRQSAKFYNSVADSLNGEFLVTMQHPNDRSPEPIVIKIDKTTCSTLEKKIKSASNYMGNTTIPRAAYHDN